MATIIQPRPDQSKYPRLLPMSGGTLLAVRCGPTIPRNKLTASRIQPAASNRGLVLSRCGSGIAATLSCPFHQFLLFHNFRLELHGQPSAHQDVKHRNDEKI